MMNRIVHALLLLLLTLLPAGSRQLSLCDLGSLLGFGTHHQVICDTRDGHGHDDADTTHQHADHQCPQECFLGLSEVTLAQNVNPDLSTRPTCPPPWEEIYAISAAQIPYRFALDKTSAPDQIPPLVTRILTGHFLI